MKRYTWISYLSLGIPIVLIISLFILPNVPTTQWSLARAIMYSQVIGVPISIILSVIALCKKNEKNTIAIFGLLLALVMIGIIAFFLYLGTHFAP
ncbi:hypothetical protein [Oceanobacillus halotolerans]|uniref:hypothetical protein n=1 Tax=Oceanobacillus halotolerans TaxID=2663380 RepID=UPI0013D99C41|nr:hypothetical protein [Oceanobacillus halotolerans]